MTKSLKDRGRRSRLDLDLEVSSQSQSMLDGESFIFGTADVDEVWVSGRRVVPLGGLPSSSPSWGNVDFGAAATLSCMDGLEGDPCTVARPCAELVCWWSEDDD